MDFLNSPSVILLNSSIQNQSLQNTNNVNNLNNLNNKNIENDINFLTTNLQSLNVNQNSTLANCSILNKSLDKIIFTNISKKVDPIPLEIIEFASTSSNQNRFVIDPNEESKRKVINQKEKIIQSRKGYTGPRNGILKAAELMQYCKIFGITCPKGKNEIIDTLLQAIKEYEQQFPVTTSTQIASVNLNENLERNNYFNLQNLPIIEDEDEDIFFEED